jgi:uncharacterized RDD family membrane protein YckC
MTAITILKDNVPHGPFTRTEVADKMSRGEFTLDSLAFVEGLTQWTPLRDVLARVDAANPSAPATSALPVSALPTGTGHSHIPAPGTAALIGTGYSYAATMRPPDHLVYAGFWLRTAAYLLDYLMLTAVALLLGSVIGFVVGLIVALINRDAMQPAIAVTQGFVGLLIFVLIWLYFALMESSRLQATLGKMALGLQVTDRQGQRIGFGRATGRFFGKIISGIILYIGFMMAGWTERKQALHDMLADTLVVRKPTA